MSKGCGVLSTPDLKKMVFDMSEMGESSTITHRCGAGSTQCPHCFVVTETVKNPLSLFIRACHATQRVKSNSGISWFPLCGYKQTLPQELLAECTKCKDGSSGICKTCYENRIRCYEDCEELGDTCFTSSAPTSLNTPPVDPRCQNCALGAWSKPSTDYLPTEAGRQFFYWSDDRVYEYIFINNSTNVLTVGTDPDASYPSWIDPGLSDVSYVPPGETRNAICYRGRFFWH